MKSKFTTFGFFILTLNRLLRLISVLCTGDGQWVKVRTCSEEGRKKRGGVGCFLLIFYYSVSLAPSLSFLSPLLSFSWIPSPSTLLAETNPPFILFCSEGPWCLFLTKPDHPWLLVNPLPNSSSGGPRAFITPTTFHIPAPAESHCPSSDFNAAVTRP